MIKVTAENLKNLVFDGIIVGVPRYAEVDQHKDILFKVENIPYANGEYGFQSKESNSEIKAVYSICYNNEKLPNGLLFNTALSKIMKKVLILILMIIINLKI